MWPVGIGQTPLSADWCLLQAMVMVWQVPGCWRREAPGIQRHLGVRPITLIGFSLGARVIFFALLELAKSKAFGIVQDVFLLGATGR